MDRRMPESPELLLSIRAEGDRITTGLSVSACDHTGPVPRIEASTHTGAPAMSNAGSRSLAVLLAGTACLGLGRPSAAQHALPDWSGVWALQGGTIFDAATVEPRGGRSGQPGVREFPPYNEEWEAIYRRNIEIVKQGAFPDPVSTCGTPHGFPRLMNLPDVYEFAVTPAAVWIIAENGPNVIRIYTDGREYPPADDLWPTYTGASIGHWDGDTLVFTTISLKESRDGDVIIDRTGLVLSDAARVTTRMRKVDDATLEAAMVIEDAKALTAPWSVIKRWDYACAENNRYPGTATGRTLTLGPDGRPIDKVIE
jgi:hypothetical protein